MVGLRRQEVTSRTNVRQHSLGAPLLVTAGSWEPGLCGHTEAKEETGSTAEGQAHGESPGREVTSSHTLSSSLPSLAQEGLDPEGPRSTRLWPAPHRQGERIRLSPCTRGCLLQVTSEETEPHRGWHQTSDSSPFPATLSCTTEGEVNLPSGTQGRLPGLRGSHAGPGRMSSVWQTGR